MGHANLSWEPAMKFPRRRLLIYPCQKSGKTLIHCFGRNHQTPDSSDTFWPARVLGTSTQSFFFLFPLVFLSPAPLAHILHFD